MQQPRKQKKVLKQAFRNHDSEAARLLLAHSVALGHERLGVRRYLAARYLGSENLGPFVPFCTSAIRHFKPQALLKSAATVARDLHLTVDMHGALSELMPNEAPFIVSFAGTFPVLKNDPVYSGAQVSLVGRLEIGSDSWFGPGVVIRGDGHFVRIGDDFRIGERGTVHIAHERFPALIGDRVTAGRNVVIHACTVGNDCVLEDGVIILDGSVIEDDVVIEARSTVFPRSTLKSGWVYAGSPAKPVRELEDGERAQRARQVSDAIFESIFNAKAVSLPRSDYAGDDYFIGKTVSLEGTVEVGADAGVFFGCRLNGHAHGIRIGANCNVQDNSFIDAANGPVTIGDDTTIGHNVDLPFCSIGSRALVGIGSDIGEGTVIEDDVLLAAGSQTLPGQRLESGWLWGGRPARAIAPLDNAKRSMLSLTIEQYRAYAAEYITAQRLKLTEEA